MHVDASQRARTKRRVARAYQACVGRLLLVPLNISCAQVIQRRHSLQIMTLNRRGVPPLGDTASLAMAFLTENCVVLGLSPNLSDTNLSSYTSGDLVTYLLDICVVIDTCPERISTHFGGKHGAAHQPSRPASTERNQTPYQSHTPEEGLHDSHACVLHG